MAGECLTPGELVIERMPQVRQPSAAYYRQVAAEIIALAKKTASPGLRRELLEFAERFRRMANYAESHAAARETGTMPSSEEPALSRWAGNPPNDELDKK